MTIQIDATVLSVDRFARADQVIYRVELLVGDYTVMRWFTEEEAQALGLATNH